MMREICKKPKNFTSTDEVMTAMKKKKKKNVQGHSSGGYGM